MIFRVCDFFSHFYFEKKTKSNVLACVSCNATFVRRAELLKRFLQELNVDDESSGSDNDDDDVVITDTKEETQTKTDVKESKKADAVEKPMDEMQLNRFYNEYILLMKDQKQEKHAFTQEKLGDILHDLFNSLQYQPDQSDGKFKQQIS